MTENYPILHVNAGVFPEMLQTTVSDLALKLINERTFNFAVRQVPDQGYLQRRYNWIESGFQGEESFDTIDDQLGDLAGYNRHNLPLMVSNPNTNIGAVQVLGKQLIFLSRGLPLHKHRDSYLFGYSLDQIYTARGFIDVVKEFLEKGYKLVVNDEIVLIQKPDFVVRKLREPTLEDFATLG